MIKDSKLREQTLKRILEGPIHCYGLVEYHKEKFGESPSYESLRDWLISLDKSKIIKSERMLVDKRPRRVYSSIPNVTYKYLETLKKHDKNESHAEIEAIVMLPEQISKKTIT